MQTNQQVTELAKSIYLASVTSKEFENDYRLTFQDVAANAFYAADVFYRTAANEGKAVEVDAEAYVNDPCEGCTGCDADIAAQQEALSHIQKIIQQKYSEAAQRNSETLQDILLKSLQKAMGK